MPLYENQRATTRATHLVQPQTYFFSSILSSTACLAWSPFACTWSLPYLVGHKEEAVSILDSAVSQSSLHIALRSTRGSG